MSIYEFLILNQEERASVVFTEATFLACCPDRGNLYYLGDFYVEVIYDGDRNEIKKVTCFKTLDKLTPYLDYIPAASFPFS